jgi:predicted GIY-YIG superfamily endonuclease
MHYVYVLINECGVVEYVGRTETPIVRMRGHKQKPQVNKSGTSMGNGQFYGRDDISMEIVKEFATKDEAKEYEGQLKIELGFEWTEKTTWQKIGRKNVETGQLARVAIEINIKRSQPVIAYRKDTGEFIGIYNSQKEAGRQLGLAGGNIRKVLSGEIKQTGGYTFKRK